MALQKPFGHIGIPDSHGGGDELTCQPRFADDLRRQPCRPPARQRQGRDQKSLDDNPAVDHRGQGGDGEILGHRPWRDTAEPERGIGEIGPRRRHRIAQKQIARRQQRAGHRERQCQRVPRHGPPQRESAGPAHGWVTGVTEPLAGAPVAGWGSSQWVPGRPASDRSRPDRTGRGRGRCRPHPDRLPPTRVAC